MTVRVGVHIGQCFALGTQAGGSAIVLFLANITRSTHGIGAAFAIDQGPTCWRSKAKGSLAQTAFKKRFFDAMQLGAAFDSV